MTVIADLLIRARRAVTGDVAQPEQPLAVGVTGGRVVAVEPLGGSGLVGRDTLELGEEVVLLPGLVDSHVHVCEPGHTEWEGSQTCTCESTSPGRSTTSSPSSKVSRPTSPLPPSGSTATTRPPVTPTASGCSGCATSPVTARRARMSRSAITVMILTLNYN